MHVSRHTIIPSQWHTRRIGSFSNPSQVEAPAPAPAAARAQSFPPEPKATGPKDSATPNGPNENANANASSDKPPAASGAGATGQASDDKGRPANAGGDDAPKEAPNTDADASANGAETERVQVGKSVDPESDRVMAGKLEKQGEGANARWTMRYVVVGGREFRYFANEAAYEAGAPPVKDRVLQLDRHAAIGDVEPLDTSAGWTLRLVPAVPPPAADGSVTPGVVVSADGKSLRTFVFRAPNKKARDDWVHVLQAHGAQGQDALDSLAQGQAPEGVPGAVAGQEAGAGGDGQGEGDDKPVHLAAAH